MELLLHSKELLAQVKDWKKLYEFTLKCSEAHDPFSFASIIVSSMPEIVDFDAALVYFFDTNGKIYKEQLTNFNAENSRAYIECYANSQDVQSAEYSIYREYRETPVRNGVHINDWTADDSELCENYIKPMGLKYTMSMLFYDLYGNFRTVIMLDRFSDKPFTEDEKLNGTIVLQILNNLHKNFFYDERQFKRMPSFHEGFSNLTTRETEIANLLCQGMSPANISKTLFISPATTYKHIANIYEKAGVNSQRELLALMLNQ